MFKVVTDQLKVSQGWVRCGQCAEIFDAQLHLKSQPVLAELPAVSAVPSSSLLTASSPAQSSSQSAFAADATVVPQVSSTTTSSVTGRDLSQIEGVVPADYGQRDSSVPSNAADLHPEHDLDHAQPHAYVQAQVHPLPEVSFVRDARRQAFWRRPLVRLMLAFVAICLTCLLAAQVVVGQRDAIAAFDGRAKPWLQALCDQLGCEVSVPRRIESIVIDSSTFNKADAKDSYLLNFSLKNASKAGVAMPFLELSLTDGQDQALVRRVLSPAQFGAASDTLAGSAEFSTTVTLQLQPSVPPLKIAGYRMLAFYP